VEENEPVGKRVARTALVMALMLIPAFILGPLFFHPTLIRLGGGLEEVDWLAPSVILRAAVLLLLTTGCGLYALKELRGERPRKSASTSRRVRLTQLPVAAACPFCKADLARADLGSGVIRCGDCEVAHHSECWQSHGGCTTLGCSRGPRERSEPSDVSVGPSR
jgi:hypothetical protein